MNFQELDEIDKNIYISLSISKEGDEDTVPIRIIVRSDLDEDFLRFAAFFFIFTSNFILHIRKFVWQNNWNCDSVLFYGDVHERDFEMRDSFATDNISLNIYMYINIKEISWKSFFEHWKKTHLDFVRHFSIFNLKAPLQNMSEQEQQSASGAVQAPQLSLVIDYRHLRQLPLVARRHEYARIHSELKKQAKKKNETGSKMMWVLR